MPRHSTEDLQQMANFALQAKREGDPRFNELVQTLSAITGYAPKKVEYLIQMLAMGVRLPS